MNGAIYAATSQQGFIGRIHDGVGLECADVCLDGSDHAMGLFW
jgi:hypothetical protein